MMTDERALKLARKLFKERTFPQYSNKYAAMISEWVDSGKYDHEPYIKGALDAIKLTTQLATEYVDRNYSSGDRDTWYEQQIMRDIRAFAHLPSDGGENV